MRKEKGKRKVFYWRMIFLIFSIINIVLAVPVLAITFFSSLSMNITFSSRNHHSECERELWGWVLIQVLILLLLDVLIVCFVKLKRVNVLVQSLFLLFLLFWTVFGLVLNALERNCTMTVLHIFVILNVVYNLIFIISCVFGLAFFQGVMISKNLILQNIVRLKSRHLNNPPSKEENETEITDVYEKLVEEVNDGPLIGIFKDQPQDYDPPDETESSTSTSEVSEEDLFGETKKQRKRRKARQSYPIDTIVNYDDFEYEESEDEDDEKEKKYDQEAEIFIEGEEEEEEPGEQESGGIQISFEEEFPELADKYRQILKEQEMKKKK